MLSHCQLSLVVISLCAVHESFESRLGGSSIEEQTQAVMTSGSSEHACLHTFELGFH
jgi:hypothetical protein